MGCDIETVTYSEPELINKDAVILALMKQASCDSQPRAIKRAIRLVRDFPSTIPDWQDKERMRKKT